MSNANRLKEILSRSKAVMQVTEQNYGSTSNGNQSFEYGNEEKEIPNLTENFINNHRNSNGSVAPVNGKYRNFDKSKMPDVIKKAMMDNPIDIPETPYHTFELDDVSDLIENTNTKKTVVKETVTKTNNNTNSVNEKTIRKIVREEMEDLVRTVIEEYFDKSLMTEDIQIRVGGTTFSGKLKPLPKKNNTV
jgi:hypothetical protein